VVLFHGPVPAWIAEPGAPLLVTPAAMAATCFGYASGYLCAVLTRRLQKRDVAGAAPEWITASFAAVAIIAAGAANAPRVDTSGARELQALARAALDNAAGRGVLATDGLMDYPLMIEARDAGRPLAVFNVAPRRADAAYLRYVASLMDTPRLKGLAMVGLLPMLMEWMDSGSGVEQRLAMQTRPDYWLSAGYSVVPRGLAYLGARRLDGLDATQLLAEHQTFWDRFTPHLDALALKPWPAPDLAAILRARVSRVANDLGVLLENVGHPLEAETAYARAIVFNGANRIARANLMDLCVRSGATNRAALLARRLAVAARRGDTPPLRLEIELHGHARTKAAYDALHVADEAAPEWPQELSDAVELFNSGKLAEARSLVDAAVQAQPGLDAAWVLQAVVADAQDDVTTVQAVFTHMRATRKQWPQLLVIMARRALAREDYLSARDYLEEVAVLWPSNAAVLDELVRVYLREGSKRYIGWAVQNLLLIDPESAVGNYAAGRMLEERKEFLLAEDAYRRVRPSSVYPSAQARLALLLAERTEWEAADGAASRAVELEPGLADAWEAVAVVRAGQGRHDEAAEARQQMVELDPKRDEARQDQE
jgi:tetratricopeptide (TPR) repeat protein